MNSDRLLRVTLAISLFTHGALLLQSPHFNPFAPAVKKQELEVHYVKVRMQPKVLADSSYKPLAQRPLPSPESFLRIDSKIIATSSFAPPYIEQTNPNQMLKPLPDKPAGVAKPSFATTELMAIKKKIILPPLEMAKIDNPSYISYYQIVREKIRRSAYQNYTHNETGEVYVSFVISNDGYIKDVRLVQERTNADEYLKDIALRSVKGASPFPNFPKELDYPQLSFNIIISFEIE